MYENKLLRNKGRSFAENPKFTNNSIDKVEYQVWQKLLCGNQSQTVTLSERQESRPCDPHTEIPSTNTTQSQLLLVNRACQACISFTLHFGHYEYSEWSLNVTQLSRNNNGALSLRTSGHRLRWANECCVSTWLLCTTNALMETALWEFSLRDIIFSCTLYDNSECNQSFTF